MTNVTAPSEPPMTRLDLPGPDGGRRGHRRGRCGPRAGHGPGGVPQRHLPDADDARSRACRGGRRSTRGILPLDGLRVTRSMRQSARTSTSPSTAPSTTSSRAAPTRRVRAAGSTGGSPRPTAPATSSAGRTRSRSGRRGRAGRWAVRRRDRWAVRRRVDVPRRARRVEGRADARSWTCSTTVTRRPAARRAVVDAAPDEPRRGRGAAAGVPRRCLRDAVGRAAARGVGPPRRRPPDPLGTRRSARWRPIRRR